MKYISPGQVRLREHAALGKTTQHSAADCEAAQSANLISGPFNQSLLTSAPAEQKIDAIQAAVERLPQAELPLTHRFTSGMYIRTIFMPKGVLVISRIHRTQHPFVVTKGRCVVWNEQDGWKEISAGHIGFTMPGTRRILYIFEDTEWTTFHVTGKTDPEQIVAEVTEPHEFDRGLALQLFEQFKKQAALT
ncbi:MAG TPA: hypothetical protein VGV18_11085 [Verrucomicrobiae bacterium]|nr:hypothetical protein [Verrucomicrobiae bacterium]